MAVEKKETVKAVEKKAPVAAAPAVKAEAPKAAAEKKPAAKKETVKKETVKKEAAPKKETVKKAPAAKKPAAKKAEPKTSVVIEYAGKSVVAKDVLAAAAKAFAKSHKDVTVKTMDVYVKPEEGVAYYVVNGEGSDEYKVIL